MSRSFDVVVLGTGPSAGRVAMTCAKAGRRVAVIDARPYGGTCALRGCNPKKVLTRAAEALDRVRNLDGHGVIAADSRIDWSALIAFKRSFTDSIPEGRETSFQNAGITTFHGSPRFTGPATVVVGEETLDAKQIFIGTGGRPADLGVPGEDLIRTSDDFLEAETLPKRIVFVGGGYISFEFAHVAARAGAACTIVEGDRPLARFEADLVDKLVERSRSLGLDVRTETRVASVERASDGSFHVMTEHKGQQATLEADLVVHGGGRVPNVEGLDLATAGIDATERGIVVDPFLRSVSNPHVLAAGDVADSGWPPLSPVADRLGTIAAQTILQGPGEVAERPAIPAVVFTTPALASVGLTEAQARAEGHDLTIRQGDWAKYATVRKVGESVAAFKILLDAKTDRILGAHLLGPGAAEVINLFAVTMDAKQTASWLGERLFAFPTFSADVRSMLASD